MNVNCRFYRKNLRITQFQSGAHRGQDLVGVDKDILAPYECIIEFAGNGNQLGGQSWTWGLLVKAKMVKGPFMGLSFLVAHLNSIAVRVGQVCPAGTVLGVEGWTGRTIPEGPGGQHLHVEMLRGWNVQPNVADLTGIPVGTPLRTELINNSPEVPEVPVIPEGWTPQTGRFTVGSTTINLRTEPINGGGSVIALLQPGTVVRYDMFKRDLNGFTWIRQPRADGTFGYMATGETKNGKRINYWGTFSA